MHTLTANDWTPLCTIGNREIFRIDGLLLSAPRGNLFRSTGKAKMREINTAERDKLREMEIAIIGPLDVDDVAATVRACGVSVDRSIRIAMEVVEKVDAIRARYGREIPDGEYLVRR